MASLSLPQAVLHYLALRSKGDDDKALRSWLLDSFAVTLVDGGLEAIRHELQAYYVENKKTYSSDLLFLERMKEVGIFLIGAFTELLAAADQNKIKFYSQALFDKLAKSFDFELAKLAALALSTRDMCDEELLNTIHMLVYSFEAPPEKRRSMKSELSEIYETTKGSGLRAAVATILLMHFDEMIPIEREAILHILSREDLHETINQIRVASPDSDTKLLKLTALKLHMPKAIGLVIWDVASKGLGPPQMFDTWVKDPDDPYGKDNLARILRR